MEDEESEEESEEEEGEVREGENIDWKTRHCKSKFKLRLEDLVLRVFDVAQIIPRQ